MLMKKDTATKKEEREFREYVELYRSASKGLLEDGNCEKLIERFEKLGEMLKNNRVIPEPFEEEELAYIATALNMPTAIYYRGGRDLDCKETISIEKLQRSILNFYFEAALFADKIKSATADAWKDAYTTIKLNCLRGAYDYCGPDDANKVASCIFEQSPRLAVDLEFHKIHLKDKPKTENLPRQEPPVEYLVEAKNGKLVPLKRIAGKREIRRNMTEKAAELIKSRKVGTYKAAAKMIIPLYAKYEGGYTESEEATFTKAIIRYCEKEGIDHPHGSKRTW